MIVLLSVLGDFYGLCFLFVVVLMLFFFSPIFVNEIFIVARDPENFTPNDERIVVGVTYARACAFKHIMGWAGC